MAGAADGGPERIYVNVKHLLSSRFLGAEGGRSTALASAFSILKTFVTSVRSEVLLDDGQIVELLTLTAALKVDRGLYKDWTACIGGFMARLGGVKFFQVLPIRLVEFDLNSLTYAQDSRSWLIQLIPHSLKKDNNLLFYVQYFLPMIVQLEQMRGLEKKSGGSPIKVKKYETMLVQVWELLPHFCRSNSERMCECLKELLKFLEAIMNKNLLGLRPVALKSLSNLIEHCRNTPVVDEDIKKTRKTLQSITMDYIRGLVTLYTKDPEEEKVLKAIAVGAAPEQDAQVFKKSEGQGQLLKTLQDFCSIAKVAKLSNLFLTSFAELVVILEQLQAADKAGQPLNVSIIKYNTVLRNMDVLFALMQKTKLKKENQLVLM